MQVRIELLNRIKAVNKFLQFYYTCTLILEIFGSEFVGSWLNNKWMWSV